jgi:hypothetical protein
MFCHNTNNIGTENLDYKEDLIFSRRNNIPKVFRAKQPKIKNILAESMLKEVKEQDYLDRNAFENHKLKNCVPLIQKQFKQFPSFSNCFDR